LVIIAGDVSLYFIIQPTFYVSGMSERQQVLKFKGCTHFRQRLVCSILSGKPTKISSIRANLETPGLQGEYNDDNISYHFTTVNHSTKKKDYEASFLRLIDKITNGTVVEINETGFHFAIIFQQIIKRSSQYLTSKN
jgi:hypothetical protein